MTLQVNQREKLQGLLFDDPLTSATETKRRNLLFVSCFSILLAVYDLKVARTPWLDFDVPVGAPSILLGALSVALLYTFTVFALYALSDLRKWHTAGDIIRLHHYSDISLKINDHLNAVSQWLVKPLPENTDKRAAVEKMYGEAEAFVADLGGAVSKAKASHRELGGIVLIRLLVLDLGVPIFLGIFAMSKIGDAFFPFVVAAFK